MNDVLVAPAHDDLDIVMVTRLVAQPKIDRPSASDSPPNLDSLTDLPAAIASVQQDKR